MTPKKHLKSRNKTDPNQRNTKKPKRDNPNFVIFIFSMRSGACNKQCALIYVCGGLTKSHHISCLKWMLLRGKCVCVCVSFADWFFEHNKCCPWGGFHDTQITIKILHGPQKVNTLNKEGTKAPHEWIDKTNSFFFPNTPHTQKAKENFLLFPIHTHTHTK